MADFIIRKIPDEVFAAFKARAAADGRIMKTIMIKLMARWALDGDDTRKR